MDKDIMFLVIAYGIIIPAATITSYFWKEALIFWWVAGILVSIILTIAGR